MNWNGYNYSMHPQKYMTVEKGEFIKYEIGDWVKYSEGENVFTGYIMDIEVKVMFAVAKVYFTNCNVEQFKSACNKTFEIPIPRLVLDTNVKYTEEFLKSAIDFALDIKDETLFNDYSKKLSKLKK